MKKSVCRCLMVFFILLVYGITAQASELFVGTENGYSSLTAAVNAAASGDVIYIAEGIYAEPSETYPIAIDLPLTLVGEPGVILKGSPFKSLLRISAPDVSIENIEFHVLRSGIINTGDGLSVNNCFFMLADATYRMSSSGLWLAGVSHCTITNCEFISCGICISGEPLSEKSQGLPVLTGLYEVGTDLDFFATHIIRDNLVNGKPLYYFANEADLVVPSDAGGVIAVCCYNIRVEGIDVSDNSIGVALIHCNKAQVTGVTADRCGIFGAYLAYNSHSSVRDTISRESNHGIDIRAAKNVTVTSCHVSNCEQGVFLSFATDSIVDNSRFSNCGNGFFIAAGEQNQLSSNLVEGNSNGAYIQGERDILISGNAFSGNTVAGLRFLRSGGQVIGNDFHNNWVGVLAAESNPLTLWNNYFSANAATGLYMRDITAGKISFNTFDDTGKAAMELDGSIVDTLIMRNTIQGGISRILDRSKEKILQEVENWTE